MLSYKKECLFSALFSLNIEYTLLSLTTKKQEQMRLAILVFGIFFFSQTTSAQLAMSFEEAKMKGLDFQKLDSIYRPGVDDDSIAVFKDKEEAYIKAYYGMLRDLSTFLNENDYHWGDQVKCFNRIYFDANGTVDYYLYDFETDLSPDKQDKFKELLNQFIINYKFSLSGEKQFAQCSPVNYRDPL